MPGSTIQKRIIGFILIVLCAACAPQSRMQSAGPGQPISTVIPTAAAAAAAPTPKAEKTRQVRQPAADRQPPSARLPAKKPAGDQPQPGEASSPSAFAPASSAFNMILGRPTDHSIAASFYALKNTQVVFTYHPAADDSSSKAVSINLLAEIPHTIELGGLSPDTGYACQLTVDGAPGGMHTFHTQRLPSSTFTFTIDADPHNRDPNFNGELYAAALTNALQDQPDFHINLGDTFMTEKVKQPTFAEAESTFQEMRPYFGILAADAPLFLVNGNHEGELGWLRNGADSLPVWSAQLRQRYFPNPIPGGFFSGASTPDPTQNGERDGYYAWTWGDALFIVLDPFWYTTTKPQPNDLNNNWNWTLGFAQYTWLKSTLETSQAKYTFVFTHHLAGGSNTDARGGIEAAPYFEWGGKNADGSYGFDDHRPGWGKPIHQLLVENGVSAVFHGHDHVYVEQELDGIIYQECPQPSITRYTNEQLAQEHGYAHGTAISSSGHLRITVSPDQAVVAYVRAYRPQDENERQQNGTVAAQYTISPRH